MSHFKRFFPFLRWQLCTSCRGLEDFADPRIQILEIHDLRLHCCDLRAGGGGKRSNSQNTETKQRDGIRTAGRDARMIGVWMAPGIAMRDTTEWESMTRTRRAIHFHPTIFWACRSRFCCFWSIFGGLNLSGFFSISSNTFITVGCFLQVTKEREVEIADGQRENLETVQHDQQDWSLRREDREDARTD